MAEATKSGEVPCLKRGCCWGRALQGYAYVPPEDDEALMEAVYSRGTIAISLDASQPSFRFYASGEKAPPCNHCCRAPRAQWSLALLAADYRIPDMHARRVASCQHTVAPLERAIPD